MHGDGRASCPSSRTFSDLVYRCLIFDSLRLWSTSTALRIAQFGWRLFSGAQRVTPNLIVDKMDRCALELQIDPEDMYSFIPSP